MKTNVYIDGFNLYHRALKSTQFKWLDLHKLAEVLFPNDSIHRVCFFTARIKARPNDPRQPQRQQTYLRALGTLPTVEIYYGTFRDGTKTLPLVNPSKQGPNFAKVKVSEEKGSDVNLATRLLVDGFNQQYEQAVVVSNDSDLTAPIRFVRDDLKIPVAVVNPDYNNRTSKDI